MKGRSNQGFTLIELLIVVAIIGIIAAIAIPGLMRARMAGNEASAIGSLRSISSGEATYSSSCGGGGYASTLDDLSAAPGGGQGFVSPDLNPAVNVGGAAGTVNKSGYVVTVAAGVAAAPVWIATQTCNGTISQSTYFAKADPSTPGGTGRRTFGTDQRGTVFQDGGGVPFTAASTNTATTPIQ